MTKKTVTNPPLTCPECHEVFPIPIKNKDKLEFTEYVRCPGCRQDWTITQVIDDAKED